MRSRELAGPGTNHEGSGVGRTLGFMVLLFVAMTMGDIVAATLLPASVGTTMRVLVSNLVAWPPLLLLVRRGIGEGGAEPAFLLRRVPAWTVVGGGLAGLGLSLLILVAVSHLPGPPPSAQSFSERLGDSNPMPLWIAMLLVAPVAEELFFRGWMLPIWERRYGPRLAILGTALLFAVMHILWWRMLITFPLGVLFGWIAWRTRSVVPAMAAHAGANAAPMLTEGLLALAGVSPAEVEGLSALPSWMGWAGAAVLAAGIWMARTAGRRTAA